jgi:hypothetical protein
LAFNGKREKKVQPDKFTMEEVEQELEKMKDVRPGKQPDMTGNKRKHSDGPKIDGVEPSAWGASWRWR